VLLPFLPFLSGAAAPIVISSLFGVAGGGLAGYRVRQRWAGVQDFDFIQITGGQESSSHGAPQNKVAVEKSQLPSLVVKYSDKSGS
jgi:hypothetical protein